MVVSLNEASERKKKRPCGGAWRYAIMIAWNGPGPVFFMSGAPRLTD